MEAPSEKHLEDWIARDIRCLGVWDEEYCNEPIYPLLGRQIKLPSGRCDLLTLEHGLNGEMLTSVCPIEIKAGAANLKALAQLLRYMGDIRKIWRYAIAGLPDTGKTKIGEPRVYDPPIISGMLIGSSASEEVVIAASAANVSVMTYEWTGEQYNFDHENSPSYPRSIFIEYSEYPIGNTIRDIYIKNIEQVFDKPIDALMEEMYLNPSINDYVRRYCKGDWS